MKLTIFGATGGTGKQVVEQALAAGNHVVANVRNPSKFEFIHKDLRIVEGELADQTMIEHAVSGADAVISVLGSRGGSKDKPITRGMQNIIAAMNKYGVRRLIVSSTLSVKDPNDMPEFKQKFLVNIVKLTMRSAYEEIISVAETIRKSDLDWTILRLTTLNNNPKSGKSHRRFNRRNFTQSSI
ncbi:MAG: NAD(P)H-binding protein [Candidatus Lokiarchaeota archaeon]|nr:NAD(P)H-binding protein [Candidatus Lokiarchaeota archaeon]